MTDHFVCKEEQKHEENQINTVEQQQKLETTKRVRIFKKLDSKLCIATMLGYFISWENLEKFFRCLHKQGQTYFDTHKTQFRYFIDDTPIPQLTIAFGEKSF